MCPASMQDEKKKGKGHRSNVFHYDAVNSFRTDPIHQHFLFWTEPELVLRAEQSILSKVPFLRRFQCAFRQ